MGKTNCACCNSLINHEEDTLKVQGYICGRMELESIICEKCVASNDKYSRVKNILQGDLRHE